MAKLYTPAMAKVDKKKAKELKKNAGKEVKSSPTREAWKRLKRNKLAIVGMIVLILIIIIAIIGPWIAPYDYTEPDYANRLQTPNKEHILGTDNTGRDILSRLIIGARISLPIGFLCVIVAFAIGGTLGAIAAFYGGKVDMVVMRILDIFQSIPPMLMAIAVVAVLGKGVINLVLSIVISSLPARARIVRASILTVKRNDYVAAGIKYEALITEVRTDLGDSITKAFGNIEELLSENGIDITEENKTSIKLAESIGMTLESTREDGYKIGDKYYNQKVYKLINSVKNDDNYGE